MKRLSLFFALLFVAIFVNAQQEPTQSDNDINTVFGKGGQAKIGWFIGLDNGYTQFDKRDVWMGGLNFGMIVNHNFAIGLSGQGWTNRNGMYYSGVTDTAGAYLEGGYGGLHLEYTLFPKSLVHVTFPVIIGAGGATYVTDEKYPEFDENEYDYCYKTLDTDPFFVIEPGVRAEINILKFMRLNAGVSYRYTSGLDLINTPDNLMNNFTASIGLKFGKF
jgi:hypothetical protein